MPNIRKILQILQFHWCSFQLIVNSFQSKADVGNVVIVVSAVNVGDGKRQLCARIAKPFVAAAAMAAASVP
ncbi:MAG: hypothetical protein H0X30_24635 [Anaerolineae bacterium]|nr:hypothetical protein [Anaerolineae bacterium]